MNPRERIRKIIRETGHWPGITGGEQSSALVFAMLGIPAYECCPNYGGQRQAFSLLPDKIV